MLRFNCGVLCHANSENTSLLAFFWKANKQKPLHTPAVPTPLALSLYLHFTDNWQQGKVLKLKQNICFQDYDQFWNTSTGNKMPVHVNSA